MDKVIEKINETVFHAEQMLLESADVRLQLPKFKFDLTSHMNEVLQNVCDQSNQITTKIERLI